jgi:hypothetical protein
VRAPIVRQRLDLDTITDTLTVVAGTSENGPALSAPGVIVAVAELNLRPRFPRPFLTELEGHESFRLGAERIATSLERRVCQSALRVASRHDRKALTFDGPELQPRVPDRLSGRNAHYASPLSGRRRVDCTRETR